MRQETLQPLVDLLHQMRTMIEGLQDIDYAMPAPGRSTGGIGGHVRHCLDHVSALLSSSHSGLCTYDRRQRGTDVETSRTAGIDAIIEAIDGLLGLEAPTLESDVLVETQLDPSGTMIITRSSVYREVAFLVSHTVHHNAIVAQLLQARGIEVTGRFGLAPATPLDSARGKPLDLAPYKPLDPAPGKPTGSRTSERGEHVGALACAR